LRCPTCREFLITIEIEKVEIDHCTACGGIWLDSGELELLLEGAANRNELMAGLTAHTGATEDDRRCPICSKRLDKVMCGGGEKVLLDVCPRNDGLWFDRGELLDVVKMGEFPADHRVFELIKEVFAGGG